MDGRKRVYAQVEHAIAQFDWVAWWPSDTEVVDQIQNFIKTRRLGPQLQGQHGPLPRLRNLFVHSFASILYLCHYVLK